MTRTFGIPNFSIENKAMILKCVDKILPICSTDWELVAKKYNELHAAAAEKDNNPVFTRHATSLERQFEILYRKKPTDNAVLSVLIRKAVAIEVKIRAKKSEIIDDEKEVEVAKEDDLSDSTLDESESESDTSIAGPSRRKPGNHFRTIGEALGDDMPPRRSLTTPEPRYKRKKNRTYEDTTTPVDAAIISLVGFLKKDLEKESNDDRQRENQEDARLAIAGLKEVREEMDSLRLLVQELADKVGELTAQSVVNRPSETNVEGENKRQKRK